MTAQKEATLTKETRVTFALLWMIAGSLAAASFWFAGDRAAALSRIGNTEVSIARHEARIERMENEISYKLSRIMTRLEMAP